MTKQTMTPRLGIPDSKISSAAKTGRIPIGGIYPSFQGEGPLAGVPTVFVRTAVCNARCRWCDSIAEGTRIMLMSGEHRPIEEIHEGDKVVSGASLEHFEEVGKDIWLAVYTETSVVGVHSYVSEEPIALVKLSQVDEPLVTTPNHQFFVRFDAFDPPWGWKEAKDLRRLDNVRYLRQPGGSLTVIDVEIREPPHPVVFYDIETESGNFIAEKAVLHNSAYTWTLQPTDMWMTPQQLAECTLDLPQEWVCLTGGEPTLWGGRLTEFIRAVKDAGRKILLETSGTVPLKKIEEWLWMVDVIDYDVKLPSSGEWENNVWENVKLLRPVDYVKFTVADHNDFLKALDAVNYFQFFWGTFLYQPVWGSVTLAELWKWMVEAKLNTSRHRLGTQLHRHAYPNIERGI